MEKVFYGLPPKYQAGPNGFMGELFYSFKDKIVFKLVSGERKKERAKF